MPRSSGTYSPPASSWYPATNGASATLADWNALLTDITNALTQSLSKDGQTVATGNIPMGSFKLTGLAAGSGNGDSVRFEQLPSGTNLLPIASGGTGAATAGAALTALGGAALGANTDITSLASPAIAAATATTQAGTDNTTKVATTAFVQRAAIMGQCYLSLSGGNLKLSPYMGNNLTINGVANAIPSAGVTLGPGGLSVSTLYYIYAYMSGATMTLEASTTGHATDTTTGVEIKSGDATRTLVGMCVPQTGPAFADSGTKRLVLSWFNRRNKEVNNLSIAGGTTGAATAQEINSSDRILFLSWNNDAVNCYANVSTTSNNSGSTWAITFGLDGTGYGYTNFNGGTAIGGPVSLSTAYCQEVSEGSHYATVMGQISGGNTLTVQGGGTSTIRAIVRG